MKIGSNKYIQFQGYFIHSYSKFLLEKTVMFKIIHTLVHRFPLAVDSMAFTFYASLYSIPIGVNKFTTYFLWEYGPFFPGKILKVCQVGWFTGLHSGLLVPLKILNGNQVRALTMPLQEADIILF